MHHLAAALPAVDGWGNWAYLAIFAVEFLESLPVLGTVIPGATVTAIAGLAAAHGILAITPSFWIVALGASLGDVGGYFIGLRSRGAFSSTARFLNERHLARGQKFFDRYGGVSVLLGRFVGPLRATVPFVAGASKMPLVPFLFWNVISAILWTAWWLSVGWVSGGAAKSAWAALGQFF